MREAGIPTSSQPDRQVKNQSGWQYEYTVPKEGGGQQKKVVQQQTMDRSHPGEPHWEAGTPKSAGRVNPYGHYRLENMDKHKVYY